MAILKFDYANSLGIYRLWKDKPARRETKGFAVHSSSSNNIRVTLGKSLLFQIDLYCSR